MFDRGLFFGCSVLACMSAGSALGDGVLAEKVLVDARHQIVPGFVDGSVDTSTDTSRGGGLCEDCVIEVHILVDQALSNQLGAGVQDFVDEVIFEMNEIWSQPFAQGGLGVGVVLSQTTVFGDGDPWNAETDAIALIFEVRDYVQSEIPIQADGRDAVILLTGVDISSIGVGFVNELCRSNSVGIAQAASFSANFVASNASHQLGHITGAIDDGSVGSEGCDTGEFVMAAPNRISPATAFSSCSLGAMIEYVFRPGSDTVACLAPPAPLCMADLTGDGILNFFDVGDFLVAFGAQDPLADFTGDGIFNFFDVGDFLDAFAAGCP